MALNLKMADKSVEAEAAALIPLFANGYFRIYDGSQPATANTAVSTQVLLAELRFGSPAFTQTQYWELTATTITADSSANASGTATWFRCLQSDGTTPLMDGSVGTATSNLILNSVAISSGAQVSVTSFVHTVTK